MRIKDHVSRNSVKIILDHKFLSKNISHLQNSSLTRSSFCALVLVLVLVPVVVVVAVAVAVAVVVVVVVVVVAVIVALGADAIPVWKAQPPSLLPLLNVPSLARASVYSPGYK